MLTAKDIDSIICSVFGISLRALHSKSTEQAITVPRNMAMLMCKKFLGWGTPRIKKHFNKRSRATIQDDLKSISGYIQTDKRIREYSELADKAINEKILYYARRKQRYNLNYRIRQKGFSLDHKEKTIYLHPEKKELLDKGQLKKLLHAHGYEVQFTIV